jgi:hypothetical protein
MSEQDDIKQSDRLRGLQTDTQEMYEAAKVTANASLALSLSKSIASLTKQIKEQDLHEGNVIDRPKAIGFGHMLGTEFTKLAKAELGEQAIPLLEALSLQIELIAEAELT